MPIVRVAMLPSLLTLGNFTCGFVAIVMALHAVGDHTLARTLKEGAAAFAAAQAADAEAFRAARDAYNREKMQRFLASSSGGPIPALPGISAAATADGFRAPPAATADEQERLADRVRRRIARLEARAADLFAYACLLIFLGMVFDTLDGRVARMTGSTSQFGAELDSLADASTFGLAPPVLLTTMWIFAMPDGKSWWGQVMVFGACYAACAALRLARYNVESGSSDRNYFHGLPSPGAAGCVAATALALMQRDVTPGFFNLAAGWFGGRMSGDELAVRALGVYTLLVGFLMVTRLTFIHVPNKYLSGRRRFTSLVLCVFLIVVLAMWKELALCLAFNGYVVWCLAHAFWRGRKRRRLQAAAAAPAA